MDIRSDLEAKIQRLPETDFTELAMEIFHYQAINNSLYARYLDLLGRKASGIHTIEEIPFLPISLFKTHRVQTGDWQPVATFTSSGTTGQTPSRHLVRDLDFYHLHARRAFERLYGPLSDWCILALLPSYLERGGSSLVDMVQAFTGWSRYLESGFFLHDHAALQERLEQLGQRNIPVLLLGVSYALLDFAEQYAGKLTGVVVMETGGMKGRRREMTRDELHAQLRQHFQVDTIHSEYGMTELLSQAYSSGEGLFEPAPSMRVLVADPYDPFAVVRPGKTGALQIVDLANIDTCSFIATEDVGRVYADGRFEVLGRLDRSELRGCNLMLEG